MAVLNKEEYLNRLNELIGDNTDDIAISLIEDFTDTFEALAGAEGVDVEEIKKEYEATIEELEAKVVDVENTWRKKYKDRFFNADVEDEEDDEDEEVEKVTFEDLFEEEED